MLFISVYLITNTSFAFFGSQKRLFAIILQGSCYGKFCKIHRKASVKEFFLVNLQVFRGKSHMDFRTQCVIMTLAGGGYCK